MALWFWRRRRTDDRPWLYYKLTNEPKGSGELKMYVVGTHLKLNCHRGNSNEYPYKNYAFMENWRKISFNCPQIPTIWASSWQNQQNELCAQRRLRSAWASAQSDQSLLCPHEESLGPKLPKKCTAKTLIRLGSCPGWSESSLGTRQFVGFVVLQLISVSLL